MKKEYRKKVMELFNPTTGLMKCKVCGHKHIGIVATGGRFKRGSWQCLYGCTMDDLSAANFEAENAHKSQMHQGYLTHHICPICNQRFTPSEYLADVFKDDSKALFIANLITHYRHRHIESWNRCWGQNGDHYREKWFGDYEEEKQKVNERAKRQIIRKATDVLIGLGITSDTFKMLQSTDEKTIALAIKKLDQKLSLKTTDYASNLSK